MSAQSITLTNGVVLEFAVDGNSVRGLAQAVVDGVPLMAPGNLRLPLVETRDGWIVDTFVLVDRSQSDDGTVTLQCEAWGTKPPIGRKLDMFQFPFLSTPRRQPARLGTMKWVIRPEVRRIGDPAVRELNYRGFSYQYEFELEHPFHWILDAGTWEAGGEPEGIRILSKHMHPCAGPQEGVISRQGRPYSTAESFRPHSSNNATTVPDIPCDPSLGFILPIQAQLRGAGGALIDAQYSRDAILFGFIEQSGYYRTLVEWRPDDPGIGHLDHHFFPLTRHYTTAAKTILAARTPGITRTDALNRWTDVWEQVATGWRSQAGVERNDPVISYSMTWISTPPCWGHAPNDMMARMEAKLDWMQANGFNCLYTGHWGNHRGHDLPDTANACEPDDYLVLLRYGGPEAFAQLCAKAHERNIKVSMWICMHLSGRGPTLKAHPDWVIHHDSSAPWDGNYRCIYACSLRTGFKPWLLDQLQQLKQLGLDIVFIDSYNNLSASPIDFRDPALPPHMPELLAFQGDCRQLGLECLIETVGPIGVTSCGLWPEYLLAPELGYWSHYRFDEKLLHDGTLDATSYFRMMANKAPLGGISDHVRSDQPQPPPPLLPAFVAETNRIYLQLASVMQVRTLHEDGSIEWRDPATGAGCLFAVGSGSVTVPDGFRAEPVHGTTKSFGPGKHAVSGLAAFRLVTVS